jgi:hypothetical protein
MLLPPTYVIGGEVELSGITVKVILVAFWLTGVITAL